MSKRRSRGRDVDGVLVLDKPPGLTSSRATQQAKKLFGAKKVGHTGSLDPLATGVLPLCFGAATKFSQFLFQADKRYVVDAVLGIATDSGDADGTVISESSYSHVTAEKIETVLADYQGNIQQIPSMFSAVKQNGQPLYKLAHQGKEVPREPRPVTIYENKLESFAGDRFRLNIHCSKGTYIRTLVADIGEQLGSGAHVVALRRTQAGPYDDSGAVTMEQLEEAREEQRIDELLLPTASTVEGWPTIFVRGGMAYKLRHGQAVRVNNAPTEGWVKVCEIVDNAPTKFLGVGEILEDGRVAPRRIMN